MFGLIKKNYYVSTQKSGSILLILGVFALTGIVTGNISMLMTMIPIFAAILPVNAIAYDNACHFDRYAAGLPVTRKQIVLAQYLTSYITLGAAFVVSTAISVVYCLITGTNIVETLSVSLGSVAVGLLYVSIVTPIVYKFGFEKLRIVILIVVMALTMVTMTIMNSTDSLFELISNNVAAFAFGGIALAVVLCVASVFISMRIYAKKEF